LGKALSTLFSYLFNALIFHFFVLSLRIGKKICTNRILLHQKCWSWRLFMHLSNISMVCCMFTRILKIPSQAECGFYLHSIAVPHFRLFFSTFPQILFLFNLLLYIALLTFIWAHRFKEIQIPKWSLYILSPKYWEVSLHSLQLSCFSRNHFPSVYRFPNTKNIICWRQLSPRLAFYLNC
jgi:hypothetical protein